ncbi:MAG: hypothetical protein QNJ69_09315 [Gammaproteobacteria bacterium]|nr:hypothetical protein [Gammaproteobacteria bacterium]
MAESVLRLGDIDSDKLAQLLARYQLQLTRVEESNIPGSFWGDQEAGLIGRQLYARNDTPLHSILHESCHYICMDQARRQQLDTDAAGDYAEENAVCYLQILLADDIPEMGRARMLQDMDAWGYSFRLGSARAWFEQDAEDALAWLQQHQLLRDDRPSYRLRL